MRYLLAASCTFLLLGCDRTPGVAARSPLQEFVSSECGFKVFLPGKPEAKKEEDAHVYTLEKRDFIFLIRFDDTEIDSNDAVLNRLRDAGVKARKGTLLSDHRVSLGGGKTPGIEYLVKAKEPDRYSRVRAYIVRGKHLCQLIVSSSRKDFVTGDEADKFFDSFTLIDQ
jgi:hypothetical protein